MTHYYSRTVGGGVWAVVCCMVAAVGAATGATAGCDITIGGDTYRRETLLSDVRYLHGLAVDNGSDSLYFSYYGYSDWRSAKLDLHSKAYNDIEELPRRCSFAVDQVRHVVHAGCWSGNDGLYAFDSNVGRFVLAGEAGRSIEFVHYHNDTLYYSLWSSDILHTFRTGHSARVQEVPAQVRDLVVARDQDWVFFNDTGVYRQRVGAGAAEATRYAGLDHPFALAVDASGAAYVCSYNGIYRLPESTPSGATQQLDTSWCSALTFDRDNNLIYGDNASHRVYRLAKC